MLAWLRSLPETLFHFRPVLSIHYAGALMASGEFTGVEARLRDAERWLYATSDGSAPPEAPPAQMVVVDEQEFRRLPSAVAMYRAGLALVGGDVTATITYARRSLELATEDDYLGHGAAAALQGLAFWTIGDLEAARQAYAMGVASLRQAGYIADSLGASIALADIQVSLGRLREAMRTYEQALELATERGAPALRGTADMHVGLSRLLYERNDLDAATQHLMRSQELGEHMGLPQNRYRWRVAMACIREAEGDLEGALHLLEEAERLYTGDFSPNVRPVPAQKVRVLVAQGRLNDALDWARKLGLSADDEVSYLREYEHITLSRVLLADAQPDRRGASIAEATGLLERLLQAAEDSGRMGSVIEILVLLALARRMQGNIPAALVSLERALTLAEPEDYVRTFVDEGTPMAALLEEAARQGIAQGYVRRLLAAFGVTDGKTPVRQAAGAIDPLSDRELDVLRLLGTELSGPDIARELVVSLNTVRTHTKNIYAKLGVNTRRAAVRRAEELGLL